MELPKIGFGTYLLENVQVNVKSALDNGYKHIDTARFYKNESDIGAVLQNYERGKLFVTTKLWCDDHFRVEEAMNESLRDLKMDYVDLYLIHWPITVTIEDGERRCQIADVGKVWQAMERLVISGKARHIGVSNFNIAQLERVLNICTIRPYANQFELHPLCYPEKLISFCKSKDIKVIAYSSLGASSCEYMSNETLAKISQETNLTIPQVLLSWAYSKGFYVIPKTNNSARIKENFKIKTIETTEIDKIHESKKLRVFNPKEFFGVDVQYE